MIRIILIILFISFFSQAQAELVDEDSFLQPSVWRAQLLAQKLDSEWAFYRNPQASKNLPFDFFITNRDWSKALLFKEGFAISSQDFASTVKFEDRTFAVVGVGLKKFEWDEIILQLERAPVSSVLFEVFVSRSFASTSAACEVSTFKKQNSLSSFTKDLNEQSFLKQTGDCALQAFQGGKEMGTEMLDFFKQLATNPLALASKMRDSFVAFKDLVMNLKSQTSEFLHSLTGLTSVEKQELACTMTGELLAGLGAGALAPGASTRILPQLALRMQKIKTSLSEVQSLRSLGINIPAPAFSQAVRCAR